MAHNKELADKQGVSDLNRAIIDKLHTLRYLIESNVEELMESMAEELSAEGADHLVELIKNNYDIWMENDRLLQILWNFPQDDNYIRDWDFPACSCPKMDNDDAYPTGHYVRSQTCLIHGWEEGSK